MRCLLVGEEVHIVCVTETFLDHTNIDFLSEYQIYSYTLYYKDRVGRRGGGVAIYIKNNINSCEVTLHNNNSELICIKVNNNNRNTNIAVVYRRPDHTPMEDLELYNSLQETLNSDETIIAGDFNLPRIDWNFNTSEAQDSQRLLEFMDDNFLTQYVREPTRGNNILDLIIATTENLITSLEVGEHLDTCDHKLVRFRLNISHTNPTIKTLTPNYRLANYSCMKNAIRGIHVKLENLNNTNDQWAKFKQIYMEAQNTYIPMKPRENKSNNKPPWFSINITRAIRDRQKLHKIKKINNSEDITNQYANSRRIVKRLIRTAKREYEINIARDSTTNPKTFYKYINSNKQIRSGIGPITNNEGEIQTADLDIANTLNNFFSSVFTINDNEDTPSEQTNSNQECLESFTISPAETLDKLNKMNINKSPGPDMFYPRILRNTSEEITEALTLIFNKSIEQGNVPEDWKMANITPIFKKGDKKLAGNYRPISLTSVVGKLLESIIRDKIVEHLEQCNLIRDSQHGFRAKRSCLTNLVEFYHKLFSINDRTKSLDIIYLDFQKAFDKVPHKKLMNKVKMLGIGGTVHAWLENWLSDRKQRVIINGVESKWVPVTSGVPQGSVLGPILFTIYINDIDVGLNNIISKFADDTKIGNSILTEEDRNSLQSDLIKIGEWSSKWQMPFNVTKCQVLQAGSKNKNYEYEINGHIINRVSHVKDLGVTIANNLKPSTQCNIAVKKANRALGYIKRNFIYKSSDIILPLYRSIVRPHLEYAVQFWAPYLAQDVKKLEAVQRRATKLIPSLRNKSYHERLRDLNLFSLEKRRLRGQLIECFKTLKGFNKVDASKLFTVDMDSRTRSNGLKLKKGKRPNLDITKNFYTFKIINEWNSLPTSVVNSETINTFKVRLDKHLAERGMI